MWLQLMDAAGELRGQALEHVRQLAAGKGLAMHTLNLIITSAQPLQRDALMNWLRSGATVM
jgi:hypothetical protein